MKGLKYALIGLLSLLPIVLYAEVITHAAIIKPEVNKSLTEFKVCDVDALAKQLSASFSVVYFTDDLAQYNYYLLRNASAMNADSIRKAVCEYVKTHQCFVFWGNVANMAMLAKQKAAWFPADTSPHYMLSPIITC